MKIHYSELVLVLLYMINFSRTFILNRSWKNVRITRIYTKKYNLSHRYIEELLIRSNNSTNYNANEKKPINNYYEYLLKQLNSKNIEVKDNAILNNQVQKESNYNLSNVSKFIRIPNLKIILNNPPDFVNPIEAQLNNLDNTDSDSNTDSDYDLNSKSSYTKSKNFELVKKPNYSFKDVGGYQNVKDELLQCVDILKNYRKYIKYNVRIPSGLILEGPPGTGKTLLAKAFAGEAKCSFIALAGSDFQEKYVGVGPTRIKELFRLARENIPTIIFIDEIDALGRKRSSDGESSSNERDNTLNALLVELDGFKNKTGVFIIAATNRVDLLDNALTRPGRIDKKIYIGLPDAKTREAIINIHIKGKPHDHTININNLIDITMDLSGAQIENLLNEAMLNALRYNKTYFSFDDFDLVMNKMIAGWQPNEHSFNSDIIDHIAIHEMGHAIVGFLSKHHTKMSKVVINLSSPKSPGYTVFEGATSNIYIREALFEHLMILLSGRIAEEVFYNVSVTTGAINDFEEALKLAEKMIIYYGMGTNIIYPTNSEKYKELIDNDVTNLLNQAYKYAELIIIASKDLIYETSLILKKEKILQADTINQIIINKYNHLIKLKMDYD